MQIREQQDNGIRWSQQHLCVQLLPGTVPIGVDIMERYDAHRAARHDIARAAVRRDRSAPAHCPNCGHHLAPVSNRYVRIDPSEAERPSPPLLRPGLPLAIMTQVVEVMARRRPVSQLADTVRDDVIAYLKLEAVRDRGEAPSLRTLHVQRLGNRAAELFGLIRRGHRHLAYSARLDLASIGWRLTAMRVLRGPTLSTATPQRGTAGVRRPSSAPAWEVHEAAGRS